MNNIEERLYNLGLNMSVLTAYIMLANITKEILNKEYSSEDKRDRILKLHYSYNKVSIYQKIHLSGDIPVNYYSRGKQLLDKISEYYESRTFIIRLANSNEEELLEMFETIALLV